MCNVFSDIHNLILLGKTGSSGDPLGTASIRDSLKVSGVFIDSLKVTRILYIFNAPKDNRSIFDSLKVVGKLVYLIKEQ